MADKVKESTEHAFSGADSRACRIYHNDDIGIAYPLSGEQCVFVKKANLWQVVEIQLHLPVDECYKTIVVLNRIFKHLKARS